ncbi:hypothetical protein LTR41_007627 [Exophiala xenobiotica]|nr:hypothetical protein LTR41_007627 [Exophiala xenobiotica]
MDVAGAVIGVVGLTGQILQGCTYICDFFHHAKDAPDSIQNLLTSVRNLNSVVSEIQTIAKHAHQESDTMSASSRHVAALNECKSVIQDLEAFVSRFKTGKGTWQRVSWAVYQKQLKEYTSKIDQAKSSVLMVQIKMLHVDQQLNHSTTFAQGQETLQRLEELPLMLGPVLQDAIQDAIEAALLVHQSQTVAKDTTNRHSSFADSQTHCHGLDGLTDSGRSQVTSWTRGTHYGLSGKRQSHQSKRVNTRFGHIEIRCTTTTQDYCSRQLTEYLTASSREIKVYVNTWLAKSVISFMSGDKRPKLPDLSFNNRLRFSRIHMGPRVRNEFDWTLVGDNSMESAVSRAIRCAEVDTVQRLLRTREAHPRDCILVHTSQTGAHGTGLFYYSLFDFMTAIMVAYQNVSSGYAEANTSAYDFRLRLYTIAQQLIVFGAECSHFWSYCAFDLYWVRETGRNCTMLASLVNQMDDVLRISFRQCDMNPFDPGLPFPPSPIGVAIAVGQDEWDIAEWRADLEYWYGKGSLEYLLNGGQLSERMVNQRSELCKMVLGLRHSLKEVRRMFGHLFWNKVSKDTQERCLEKRRFKFFDAELACGELSSGFDQQVDSSRQILSSQQAAHNHCARGDQSEIACADDDDASYNGGCDDGSDGEGYVTADE